MFNIVTENAPAIGEVWTFGPLVRKLTFTGSTAVGKRPAAACAPTLKRVSMKLGGNAPFIVFEDADLDVAVTPTQIHRDECWQVPPIVRASSRVRMPRRVTQVPTSAVFRADGGGQEVQVSE